ncbi:MAG: (4Fe-4S)-binding protein [Cyclobacteriaceae bacterium]|nr:(4Fe-4S)-binding protein [Cyclobacteriaceae bacterium]
MSRNIKKEYSNGEVTVIWQPRKCVHSANCIRNLAQVFRPLEQPWVRLEFGSTKEISDTVDQCPSGALSLVR